MRLVKTLLPIVLAFTPVMASAATIIGGNTRVDFGAAITGLTAGLTGTASIVGGQGGLTVNFPITGGELDAALAGQIFHDGSGITLSNGINVLGLQNFIIDTTISTIFGDASLNGIGLGNDLPLFTFNLATVTVPQLFNLNNPQLALFLTSTGAFALSAAFGVPDLTGQEVATAATAPILAAIPEPEAWALMIVGFGMVGASMRIRARTRAVAA